MTLKLSAQAHAHTVDSLGQPVLLMPAEGAASVALKCGPTNAEAAECLVHAPCLGRCRPSALTQPLISPVINLGLDVALGVDSRGKMPVL